MNEQFQEQVREDDLLSRMSEGVLPLAPIWDDVRTLSGQILPPIDIIYGGFPCQDISIAGRGAPRYASAFFFRGPSAVGTKFQEVFLCSWQGNTFERV